MSTPSIESRITDTARIEFLKALDNSDLAVTDWEARFIESFLSNPAPSWFSAGRRKSTDAMINKYSQSLGSFKSLSSLPSPDPVGTLRCGVPAAQSGGNIPAADPGACGYLIPSDGRYQPCNQPATHRLPRGFRYCQDHANQVTAQMKRHGKTIVLYPVAAPRQSAAD